MIKTAKISTTILIVVLIVVVINILSESYNFRLDLTEDREYTLSKATGNILKDLDKPVTVTAYFSKDLPPNIGNISGNLKDMLVEYNSRSNGMVVYKFVNPNETEQTEQEAVKAGIQPLMINVRDKDQIKQQKAYLGAIVSMGDEKEIIPFIQPGSAMEYALSTAIKKLSVTNKPVVAFIQGHGEPSLNEIPQVYQELGILYDVQSLTLTDTTNIPENIRTLALVRPKDTIPDIQLAKIDGFLSRGGNLLLAVNRVDGNFQNATGSGISNGLENWLLRKGVTISDNFVIDANCGAVTLQQQQGNFTMQSQVRFPYLPVIGKFADNPITKGLESVTMQFASPITFAGDTAIKYTPIAISSDKSGSLRTPLYFDIQKQWQLTDFPMKNLVVGAIIEVKFNSNIQSRIVLFSDGDFAVGGNQRGMQLPPDNINLMVNSIDWLSDATGLIELRTKGVTSRPIKEMEDSTKTFVKWLNFLLPIILIVVYGLVRIQMNHTKRIKRMEVSYE
jgi:gliding-associated putative ABC transporter substrate-binding component GldG